MRIASLLVALGLAFTGFARDVAACPLCSPPGLTLSEQLNQADVALLVLWVESQSPNRESGFAGATTYEIVEIIRDASSDSKPGARIQFNRDRPAQPGDLFVLLGNRGTNIDWDSPLAVSEVSYQYIKQAPTQETPATERLRYFLKFLEDPDPLVAGDAYSEFAGAPYKDIVLLKAEFPRPELRNWLADPDTLQTRRGLYGLMLGLCGSDEDAQFLRSIIEQPSQDYPLGIDGIMGGYVLLAGDAGLDWLASTSLRDPDEDLSKAFAAMQVLRFLWTYAPERIPADRLRAAMRTLLDRPDLVDIAITDLARWEDWSVTDRLWEMYGQQKYESLQIKRSIVRFLLVAERVKGEKEGDPQPESAFKARHYLEQIKQSDPQTFAAAKRLFFIN